MTDQPQPTADAGPLRDVRVLLWVLAAATFLIFFQAFTIAPLIPRLAVLFDSTPRPSGGRCPPTSFPTAL